MLNCSVVRVFLLIVLALPTLQGQQANRSSPTQGPQTAAKQAAANHPAAEQEELPSGDGQAIFLERCAKCHGEKGEGVSGVIGIGGPNIQAVHNPGEAITAMEVGPGHMPRFAFLLSLSQMRAVADYVTQNIAAIPLGGGDLQEGGKLFRVNCAPCHQTAVRGGALTFTGINAPALDTKSAAIVAGAIRWGPGPMPSFPPSVLTDQQLNSIVKYVEAIQQPPNPGGRPLHWFGPVSEGFAAWVVLFSLVGLTIWIEWGGKG
jgi:ubiquinol-cytochrome c reductase cytochrome c subunit